MYRRKASDDQRPIIMMVKVGICARYIAIAPPERMEWVPISSGLKPRMASPTSLAAERSLTRTVAEEIVDDLPLVKIVLTVVLSLHLG